MWFQKNVDALYVPSDTLEKLAKRKGIPVEKTRKIGLPIRPGFQARDAEGKETLRAELGLLPKARTALVVGGGDGVGKIRPIATELASKLSSDGGGHAQIVVICGKNEQLKAQLEAEDWPENVHVSVQGFVRNMDEWMGASDCIVSKAGPGTIAEATASGLPIILTSFLPGQEAGNVPFVVKGGFGAYSTRPRRIAQTVSSWLSDPQHLAEMSSRSSAAGKPTATAEIAAELGQMLFPNKTAA
jgi:1,2-diacylglycerol 3-beta-galactosyltransferase